MRWRAIPLQGRYFGGPENSLDLWAEFKDFRSFSEAYGRLASLLGRLLRIWSSATVSMKS